METFHPAPARPAVRADVQRGAGLSELTSLLCVEPGWRLGLEPPLDSLPLQAQGRVGRTRSTQATPLVLGLLREAPEPRTGRRSPGRGPVSQPGERKASLKAAVLSSNSMAMEACTS